MTLLCTGARLARRPLFIPRGVIHESSVRNTGKMNGGGRRRRDAPGKGSSNNRGIKRELKVCRSRICVKRRKGRVIRRRDIEATAAARMKRNDGEGCGVNKRNTSTLVVYGRARVLFVVAHRAL